MVKLWSASTTYKEVIVRSFLFVLALSAIAISQTQLTPQQQVSNIVTQQVQLSSQIVTILNQIPELVSQNEQLRKQVEQMRIEIAELKKEKK